MNGKMVGLVFSERVDLGCKSICALLPGSSGSSDGERHRRFVLVTGRLSAHVVRITGGTAEDFPFVPVLGMGGFFLVHFEKRRLA